jgi:NADH-quinone oxidoreductase subunit H
VLIYFAISSAVENSRVKLKAQAVVTDSPEPDFPVPAIPNSRAEQLNG